jgi:cysteinyl-tRNA synthetase
LDDNLNTAVALAAVHNFVREVNTAMSDRCQVRAANREEILAAIDRFDSVLNVFGDGAKELLDDEIQSLIEERQEARRQRNFARADDIRHELAARGIVLEDTKDGVRWKRK